MLSNLSSRVSIGSSRRRLQPPFDTAVAQNLVGMAPCRYKGLLRTCYYAPIRHFRPVNGYPPRLTSAESGHAANQRDKLAPLTTFVLKSRTSPKHIRLRDALLAKEAEHERMTFLAKDFDSIRQYLDAAPDGLTYERLSLMVARDC